MARPHTEGWSTDKAVHAAWLAVMRAQHSAESSGRQGVADDLGLVSGELYRIHESLVTKPRPDWLSRANRAYLYPRLTDDPPASS
jgi:hypothetical protein